MRLSSRMEQVLKEAELRRHAMHTCTRYACLSFYFSSPTMTVGLHLVSLALASQSHICRSGRENLSEVQIKFPIPGNPPEHSRRRLLYLGTRPRKFLIWPVTVSDTGLSELHCSFPIPGDPSGIYTQTAGLGGQPQSQPKTNPR